MFKGQGGDVILIVNRIDLAVPLGISCVRCSRLRLSRAKPCHFKDFVDINELYVMNSGPPKCCIHFNVSSIVLWLLMALLASYLLHPGLAFMSSPPRMEPCFPPGEVLKIML